MKSPQKLLTVLGTASAFLALACAVYVFNLIPRDKEPYKEAEKMAVTIELTQGADHVKLLKQGTDWQVEHGTTTAPANPQRMQSLFQSLSEIALDDVISYQADRAADFEVTESSGTRIIAKRADNAVIADGIVGKQAPDFSHFYFRYADRPEVYLAAGPFRGELSPGRLQDWIAVSTATAAK